MPPRTIKSERIYRLIPFFSLCSSLFSVSYQDYVSLRPDYIKGEGPRRGRGHRTLVEGSLLPLVSCCGAAEMGSQGLPGPHPWFWIWVGGCSHSTGS